MNPFVTKGYISSKYFCDREKESQQLLRELENGNDVALVATRKIGKSGLIQHCFDTFNLGKDYNLFFIDFYATGTLREMVYMLSRSIVNALAPKGTIWLQRFSAAVRSLSFVMTTDLAGIPKLNLQLGDIREPFVTLEEIFHYLEHSEKPNIIAIDEFQQIMRYPDASNVEAMLRTYIQRCVNATFIFAGSKRHLMGEIFTSPSRPFYQSVLIMNLKPISIEKYEEFARIQFEKNNKFIDNGVVADIYNRFDAVTSCIQRVLNVLYLKTPTGQHCSIDMVEGAIEYILDMFSETYADLLDKIPEKQREVFIAIAREVKAKNISSKAFVKKYHLQTVSVVTAAVRALLDKDFITLDKGTYTVYDPFFALWITRRQSEMN